MYKFKSQFEDEGQTFVDLIHATNERLLTDRPLGMPDLEGDEVIFGRPTYLGLHADRHVEVYPEAIVVFPPGPPTEVNHRLGYPGDDTITVIPLTRRCAEIMADAAAQIQYVEYRYEESE